MSKEGQVMRHEVVRVTPELAAEWLARPTVHQRSINPGTVAKYARAMYEGRWREPSIDPIAFTPMGKLSNGQHRLSAVIRAGVTLLMLVAFDVPEDQFDIIDTGRRRSASQFVKQPHATGVTAAARMILWYDHRRLADPHHPTAPSGSALQFDNDELLALIEGDLGDTLALGVREASRAMRWSGIPVSTHAAVLTIARREGADPSRIDSWLDGLIEGVGLDIDDPRRKLRQRLTDTSSAKHIRRHPAAVWMLTVRAFNAFMQGRPVKTLKYESADQPPAIDITGRTNKRESVARTRTNGVVTQSGVTTPMAASA